MFGKNKGNLGKGMFLANEKTICKEKVCFASEFKKGNHSFNEDMYVAFKKQLEFVLFKKYYI